MKNPFYDLRVKIHESAERRRANRPPKAELPIGKARVIARQCTVMKKHLFIWTMLIIPILSWLVFWFYTNFNMILMAFQTPQGDWTVSNFQAFWANVTTPGDELLISIRNTLLYFAVNVVIILPVGTLIAYFIYKKIFGYKFFRVAIFLPAIIPSMVLVTVFSEMLRPNGPFDQLGWTALVGLLDDPVRADVTATPTVMFYCVWTGFSSIMLLMSGSMARIPVEVLEAAKLDGCGPFREFRSLVVPLILPTLMTQVIFSLTGLLGASGPILLMTGGQHKTSTISYYIFIRTLNGRGSMAAYNLVSATGLVFTAVMFPIILIVKWLSDKIQTVEY